MPLPLCLKHANVYVLCVCVVCVCVCVCVTSMLALKDVLEKRGILSEVRAKLRTEIYNALDDKVVVCLMLYYTLASCIIH